MEENTNSTIRKWTIIGGIAAVFAIFISFILILNYVQINKADPIGVEVINKLVDDLAKDQKNETLRQEIRTLDLIARKAYFTSLWQLRTGGYLLLIFIAISLIAVHFIDSARKKNPDVDSVEKDNLFSSVKRIRQATGLVMGGFALVALLLTFLTHNNLANDIKKEQMIASGELSPENVEEAKEVKEKKQEVKSTSVPETSNKEEEVVDEKSEEITEVKEEGVKEEEAKAEIKEEITTEKTAEPKKEEAKGYNVYSESELKKNFVSFRGYWSNGVSDYKNIPETWDGASGQNIKWKVELPLPGYNSPIVWEDKIFVSGANPTKREVWCIDRHTGKFLWTKNVEGIEGSPAKSPKTTDDTGLAAPGMATEGNYVFAIFGNGDLIALDMQGKQIWAKNLGVPGNHYGHSSSLLCHKEKLFVQYDHKNAKKVMAFDVKTGKQLWSTDRKVKISWASPVLAKINGKMQLILASDPYVAAYDLDTGKEIWRQDCIYGEVGPSVAVKDNIVFAVNEYAVLAAIKLDGQTPSILWENDEYLSDVASPVVRDKYFILATSYSTVVCYDTNTGKNYWEYESENGFYATPLINGNKLYMIDKQGVMNIVKLGDTFQLEKQLKLGERVDATPAMVDGAIYIRGLKNLYAIGN